MNSKLPFKQTAAVLALGLFGFAAAPAAQAADYSSNMLVQLTLVSAVNSDGLDAFDYGASATFSNAVFGTPVANATGGAWAAYDPYLYSDGSAYLEHDQNVTGSAWNGNAYSELLSNGNVHLEYDNTDYATFTFSWAISGAANVNGPGYADAFASAEIFDSNFENDIFYSTGVMTGGLESDSIYQYGTFTVTVGAYGNSDISVLVGNNGTAVAAVPEADTYALMLAGIGLVGFMARRRKA